MEELILICEDSIEGVFSAIYEVYAKHLDRQRVRIQTSQDGNYRLFASYQELSAQPGNAMKVAKTVRTRLGEDVYKDFCLALATEDGEKAQAVFRTLERGLEQENISNSRSSGRGFQRSVLDELQNDWVRKVMELSRRANNELLHLKGFLRFQELEQGILFSKIGPRDNILPMLAPHFADRLPGENFIIYDERRDVAAVHPAMADWYLVSSLGEELAHVEEYRTLAQETYEELFRHFCHTISIKERSNLDLQKNMLPLRFRKYMQEFEQTQG